MEGSYPRVKLSWAGSVRLPANITRTPPPPHPLLFQGRASTLQPLSSLTGLIQPPPPLP